MDYAKTLVRNLKSSVEAKERFLQQTDRLEIFAQATACVVEAYRAGARLYIAGNGGSAADAQHLAAEFITRLTKERNPLPAEALTTDTSTLTAIGNDYGYDFVFSRQVAAKMRKGDIFLGITTSGRSPNIIAALRECRRMGITSVLFCGRDGGDAKPLADYCILAEGNYTGTIQEQHIVFAHTLCECVEKELFGE
jgi:D-sedoheptulose 7-phosphate isomerase